MKYQKRDANVHQINQVISREALQNCNEPDIINLKEAADFIRAHLDLPVHIVGDYDVDGICATANISYAMLMLGVKCQTRLPRRFTEGYGLSEKIIDEIPAPALVITVDNGIAAGAAIRKAKEKGLFVVVTDHHLPAVDEDGNKILPDADVVVDPAAFEESPYQDYCGAAVAYRLAKELLPDADLVNLKILASIATVTDVVPLTGPNHHLVKEGLSALNKGYGVPGLRELIRQLKLGSHISEGDYGFKIGPVFNAPGRLKDAGAQMGLDVLMSKHGDPALRFKVDRLIKLNEQRKMMVNDQLQVIHAYDMDEKSPIVVYDPMFHEGIVGILAGKLTEEYHCPAIVFSDNEHGAPGTLKGSGRSIPEKNLKSILDSMSDEMIGYGGHAGAAGISIQESNLDQFTERFKEAVGELPGIPDVLYYDLDLNQKYLEDTLEEQELYAPYGEKFPKLIYRLKMDVSGMTYSRMGDGSHFALRDKGTPQFSIVGFGMTEQYESLGKPKKIDCIGTLDRSWNKDEMSYKFELISFTPVED